MRTDRAARDIRKKKTEYISDAAQRQRIGQIEDAQQTAEYQDVLQQEADLTAGHGVLRCTGFVAVSASDPDELERAVAAIEQAAIQASCETRRLWGQQAQAFAAAALPLAERSDANTLFGCLCQSEGYVESVVPDQVLPYFFRNTESCSERGLRNLGHIERRVQLGERSRIPSDRGCRHQQEESGSLEDANASTTAASSIVGWPPDPAE